MAVCVHSSIAAACFQVVLSGNGHGSSFKECGRKNGLSTHGGHGTRLAANTQPRGYLPVLVYGPATSVKTLAAAAEGEAAPAPTGKKAAGKKAAAKPIEAAMKEDIVPPLMEILGKEEGISSLQLSFENNTLCGQFRKNGIPYSFWAFFPDGKLEGSRGFSLTSLGNPPSTVEPFIIDERRITPEIVVFWVQKRLFMHKLLALN